MPDGSSSRKKRFVLDHGLKVWSIVWCGGGRSRTCSHSLQSGSKEGWMLVLPLLSLFPVVQGPIMCNIFTVGLPTSTNQVKNSLYICLQIFFPGGDPVCHLGGDKD